MAILGHIPEENTGYENITSSSTINEKLSAVIDILYNTDDRITNLDYKKLYEKSSSQTFDALLIETAMVETVSNQNNG